MITITLPDNRELNVKSGTTVFDIANSIGPGLAKSALAGKVNNKLVDTCFEITTDAKIQIITAKDEEGLEVIRHSTAHILAQAVQRIFPDAQVTIGPVIENGFYYDFAYKRPFTIEDLEKIEQEMEKIIKEDLPVSRSVLSRADAIKLFEKKGEKYKVEIIKDIPGNEDLSFYQQGEFIDLCRGPHIPSTGKVKAIKLMKVAGAYWRGDSNNEMLQRIYGTAWQDKKALKAYLFMLEEAEKRDHRKLGKKYQLFHMQDSDPGMVFWHDKGWTIYQVIEQYIRNKIKNHGYQEVKTPSLLDRGLWEKSGHWEVFKENMFTLQIDNKDFAIKPMNCPCHVQIFNQGLKSYRDLPIRLSEFGSCHRNEPSGALHGLMRARNFTQDDAHIFCSENDIQSEVSKFIILLQDVYEDFGFNDIIIKLSTRPEKRVGSDEIWDKAEKGLEQALNNHNLQFEILPGEGAFYGPKIEFSLKDCLGRIWQCGTVQIDFSMPKRLDAEFVNEAGEKETPVIIHRAILGSMERFIGILIEDTAGSLPTWLAPLQAIAINVSQKHTQYTEQITEVIKKEGFRIKSDIKNEKIGFKIREHTIQRVPYIIVIGDKEVENKNITVRTREGEDLGAMSIQEFTNILKKDIANLNKKKNKIAQEA